MSKSNAGKKRMISAMDNLTEKHNSIVEGVIWKQLLLFFFPILLGTFFQQLPMIANTTRQADPALIEAAQTLGAGRKRILMRVVIPSVLPKLYKDMRILLGWAWTYLIVAEVVGTTTGISWFITQQAKYRNFANVYAAIVIIGCIGLACDMFLAWFAKQIFPWEAGCRTRLYRIFAEVFGPRDQVFSFTLKKHSPENVEE